MNTAEAFWAKVDKSGECWLWTGAQIGRVGEKYGQARWFDGFALAHRIAYTLEVGPIPEGLTLDHLCRTHLCVRPAHLEAVSQRENILRGTGVAARHARQTRCIRGHELVVRMSSGRTRRDCPTCARSRKTGRVAA